MGGEVSNRYPSDFHPLPERNEHEIMVGLTHHHPNKWENIVQFEALSSNQITLKAGEIQFLAT
jgi:hypothetical protein